MVHRAGGEAAPPHDFHFRTTQLPWRGANSKKKWSGAMPRVVMFIFIVTVRLLARVSW
jgi:hypothetical protein